MQRFGSDRGNMGNIPGTEGAVKLGKVKKVILNAVIFFLVLGLTVYGVFHGEDMGALKEAIGQARLIWLLPAVGCVFIFIWGESIIICVTPSASGGQPMQIYFMKKEKIPIPVATVILMIVTITYKLVLVVIGLGIILFAREFLHAYLGEILFVFYLGVALNVFCVTFMMVLVFHPFLAKQMMLKGLWILEKLHLMRHKEERTKKLEASMDMYNETAAYMSTHMWLMIRVFLITFGQRIALFAATCFVYQSFGLSGTHWLVILTLQAVISVSVDMLPLPGGMGISESLFLIIFKPVFGALLLPGMILSRGLGYYSQLLISAVFTLVAVVVFQSKRDENAVQRKRQSY